MDDELDYDLTPAGGNAEGIAGPLLRNVPRMRRHAVDTLIAMRPGRMTATCRPSRRPDARCWCGFLAAAAGSGGLTRGMRACGMKFRIDRA
jgi:hypothetical protein